MWGQYVTLPYKNLSYWQAFSMAIPFAWADWFFMTFAVDVGHSYELVTPTQDTFLLIILQFSLVLLINRFYLKQKVYKSDIYAFFILLIGYFVSFFHLFSKLFNIPIHKEPNTTNKISKKKQGKKIKKYNTNKEKKKKNKKVKFEQ